MLTCVWGMQAAGSLEVEQAGMDLQWPHHVGVFAEVDLDGGLINTLQVERAVCSHAAASGTGSQKTFGRRCTLQ